MLIRDNIGLGKPEETNCPSPLLRSFSRAVGLVVATAYAEATAMIYLPAWDRCAGVGTSALGALGVEPSG